jgi:hypothetical protein
MVTGSSPVAGCYAHLWNPIHNRSIDDRESIWRGKLNSIPRPIYMHRSTSNNLVQLDPKINETRNRHISTPCFPLDTKSTRDREKPIIRVQAIDQRNIINYTHSLNRYTLWLWLVTCIWPSQAPTDTTSSCLIICTLTWARLCTCKKTTPG